MDIERGNSKHAIWMDDEMAREVGERFRVSNEALIPEMSDPDPLDDGGPILDPQLSGASPNDHDALSRFAGFLRRSIFPADGPRLLAEARYNSAPDDVLDAIATLPPTVSYHNSVEVWAAIAGTDVPRANDRF